MSVKYKTDCYECKLEVIADTEKELEKHFSGSYHKKKSQEAELASHKAGYPIYHAGGEMVWCGKCSMDNIARLNINPMGGDTSYLVRFPCSVAKGKK